jgi:hypothetical protein
LKQSQHSRFAAPFLPEHGQPETQIPHGNKNLCSINGWKFLD